MNKKILVSSLLILCMLTALMAGCSKSANKGTSSSAKKITIGISLGVAVQERWTRDLAAMAAKAKTLGADVISNTANGDQSLQISQIENMLTKNISVLIVIPADSKAVAPVVADAHDQNVKVISYDRMIEDADLDYYITFDMIGVGEAQAKYLTNLVPKGNYFLLAGPQSDPNAQLFRKGEMNIVQPLIDKGDIKVVADQWTQGWDPQTAMNETQQALTANNNKIDAILAENDGTASGAVQALIDQHLDGKVPITGQDADLLNCQYIVQGQQSMTIYKQLPKLADTTITAAVDLANGKKLTTNGTYNNGKIDVPSINLPIISCDKTNMVSTVIADGFHTFDEVYKNVPADQRPSSK